MPSPTFTSKLGFPHAEKKELLYRIEELATTAFSTIYHTSNDHQSPK